MYFVSFIDDFSRMTWLIVVNSKGEAFEIFKQWKALFKNQSEKKIKRLQNDNGLEFCLLSLMSSVRMKGSLGIILSGIHHNRMCS